MFTGEKSIPIGPQSVKPEVAIDTLESADRWWRSRPSLKRDKQLQISFSKMPFLLPWNAIRRFFKRTSKHLKTPYLLLWNVISWNGALKRAPKHPHNDLFFNDLTKFRIFLFCILFYYWLNLAENKTFMCFYHQDFNNFMHMKVIKCM